MKGTSDQTLMSAVERSVTTSHPYLKDLLLWIPYMNISWRKVLLDICQTRLPPSTERISITLDALFQYPPQQASTVLSRKNFDTMCANILSSDVFRSIVMVHVRSETSLVDDGSEQVLFSGLAKEINASQNPRQTGIDYRALFDPYNEFYHWSMGETLSPTWISTAKRFCGKLVAISQKLSRRVIYPEVQRRKNTSTETCNLLYIAGYRNGPGVIDTNSFTTKDLEVHYHRTGEQIRGIAEMRWSWRYNDLKPRAYYCGGGDTYWSSRYIKKVAVEFMECLPISSSLRRAHPDDAAQFTDAEDFVTLWDLSSFTTNLAELRHFLFWCACYLDEYAHKDYPLRLFDYREGIVEMHLSDLLFTYNQEVNFGMPYSLHRIIDEIGLEDSDFSGVVHQNSGALGVAGNIGFSTCLGGLHTANAVTSMNSGAAIGDDVLGITKYDPRLGLVQHIQQLGDIAEEKFEIFEPKEVYHDDDGWKFVKRAFRRVQDGFTIGQQLDIPILAYVYNIHSRNRKFSSDTSRGATISRFVAQVSSLLWQVQSSQIYVPDSDLDLIHHYLRGAYRRLGIPTKGCLPGYRLESDEDPVTMILACPSIDFRGYDPRIMDWAEHLWYNAPCGFAILPLVSATPIHLEGNDQYEICTSTKFNRVWEDCGYLEVVESLKEVVMADETNYRRFRSLLSGEGYPLVKYRVVQPLPPLFYLSYFQIQSTSFKRSGLQLEQHTYGIYGLNTE